VTDPVQLTHKIRESLTPCSLGRWPTPLEPASSLAAALGLTALWLKREDRSAAPGGGVKVRGLEFLLADAPDDTVFVTIGATGSTHCLATAVHARTLGRRSALAQFPQPDTASTRAVAAAAARAADVVVRARSLVSFPLALAAAWSAARRRGRPRWIPGGGAHPRAVVGHCLAGLELAAQLDALPSPAPPPDAIVVPLGTGGTAAGLLLAVSALGWPTTLVAVRVAPLFVANGWRVRSLARRAAVLLRPLGVSFPTGPADLYIVNAMGRGYGHPTAAGEAARHRAAAHGVTLDPTYGAKAFGAVAPVVARGFRRIVFWHTFAPPGGTEGTASGSDLLRVETGGATLAVEVRGAGLPVLFVHGFPFDRSVWKHQVAGLAHCRRIALDLRGAGASTAPAGGYSMSRYADDLAAVLDAVGVDRAVVCGLSMGGYVTFELLRRHPQRVRALILCDTKPEADSPRARHDRDELAAVAEREGAAAVAERLVPKLLAPATRAAQPDVVRQVWAMIQRTSVTGIVGALHALRDRPDSTPLLPHIRLPTLVVGGADDEISPPAVMRAMAAAIPGAQFTTIPAAGHLTPLEQPLPTTRRLAEFLDALG